MEKVFETEFSKEDNELFEKLKETCEIKKLKITRKKFWIVWSILYAICLCIHLISIFRENGYYSILSWIILLPFIVLFIYWLYEKKELNRIKDKYQ